MQFLCDFFRGKRVDQFADVTVEQLVQLVQGKADAVIRHAVLRIILGADALAAIARADLRATRACDLLRLLA